MKRTKEQEAEIEAVRAEYKRLKALLPPMPKHIDSRSGCKVGWYVYKSMKEAKIASQHFKLDAEWHWYLGYDFGYLTPGDIQTDHKKRRYTVVSP
jgi:hypothetical protein